MTVEQVRKYYDAKPFRPFTIHFADGRTVPVLDRELIMATPSGRTLVVCQPDDTFTLIDVPHIADIKSGARSVRGGKRRK